MNAGPFARLGILLLGAACAGSGAPAAAGTSAPAPSQAADAQQALIPAGHGSLRQDDIAVQLDLTDVRARLFPLDESVIRVLAPDSYGTLRDLVASRREEIERLARLKGLRERNLWYVSFNGLAPEARFTPTDITITAAGREFRPLEIVPVSGSFGTQTLRARETKAAIFLFDDGLDLSQPLTVSMGGMRSTRWQEILRTIERERALVRARARS